MQAFQHPRLAFSVARRQKISENSSVKPPPSCLAMSSVYWFSILRHFCNVMTVRWPSEIPMASENSSCWYSSTLATAVSTISSGAGILAGSQYSQPLEP